MPDVFLSYSREDQVAAQRFASGLEREGLSVWWDQSLRSGENYDQVTERALREARAVVVLWSKTSVDSRWVRAEATQADRLGTLVPAMIEPCMRPIMFELKQTADLAHWKGEATDPAWRSFVADVRKAFQAAATAAPQPQAAAPLAATTQVPAAARGGTPSWRWAVIGVVTALVIGGGIYWLNSTRQAGASVASAPAVTGPVTLAVLPFANLSADQEQEYFSDGLTEEILNQLAQVKELAVTGRTSSFSFKGKNEDLREIARKLDVSNLLEGSVRKNGGELRITAQLIDGASGAHRWSKTYDRELSDVFAMQEEIASDVARALSVTLDVGETSRARGGTTDVGAYENFLKARKLFLEGGRESALQATVLLQEAVRQDPRFIRAWEMLSRAAALAAIRSSRAEAERLTGLVRQGFNRVRELDPEGITTKTVKLEDLVTQKRWSEAIELAEALEDSSIESGDIQQTTGTSVVGVYLATGRVNDALRLLQLAMQREPLSMLLSNDLQRSLFSAGRFDESQAENERSRGLPGDWSRARGRAVLLALRRDPIDAAALKGLLAQTNRDEGLVLRSVSELAKLGTDRKAMLEVVRREYDSTHDHTGTELILFYQLADALGDRDFALTALEAMIGRSVDYPGVWIAASSGIRSDPRFKKVLEDVGLADYFRESGKWGDFCRPVGETDFECR